MRVVRFATLCVAASVALASPAGAQSEADVALARQLATEGIKLWQGKKFAPALDKLQRAEALYDAPIHVVYIARCQVELGRLVEASEAYRKLARVQLAPNAPQAFKDAVEAAEPELEKLEPKIPSLRIDVEPKGVNGLDVRIDGQAVSAAVIGLERPTNPGSHTVRVAAPGYEAAEKSVALEVGGKQAVQLTLVAGAEPRPVAAKPPGDGTTPPAGSPGAGTAPAEPGKKPGKVGFMVGARVGALFPTGDVGTAAGPDPLTYGTGPGFEQRKYTADELFGVLAGAELLGGVRFLKHFTGFLFVGGYGLTPGDTLKRQPEIELEVKASALAVTGGLGIMAGTERGRFGGFGMLAYEPLHAMIAQLDVLAPDGASCTDQWTYRGSAVRVGGGLNIPVGEVAHLVPYLTASFGSFSEVENKVSGTCGFQLGANGTTAAITDAGGHTQVLVGLGGDLLFGSDKPLK